MKYLHLIFKKKEGLFGICVEIYIRMVKQYFYIKEE